MELTLENSLRKLADTHACPKCGMSGQLTVNKDIVADILVYSCAACKQITRGSMEFFAHTTRFLSAASPHQFITFFDSERGIS